MYNLPIYTPHDWFWIVADDETRAWSSASGAYVNTWDDAACTPIASETELCDVLASLRLKTPIIRPQDYAAAIEVFIADVARQRGYDSGISLASYVGSTNAAWAAEAAAFVAWRDDVWEYAYQCLDKVQSGQRTQPTIAAILAELPSIQWPV